MGTVCLCLRALWMLGYRMHGSMMQDQARLLLGKDVWVAGPRVAGPRVASHLHIPRNKVSYLVVFMEETTRICGRDRVDRVDVTR